jgi:hypothetical protein
MPTNNAINSNIPIEISKGGTGSTTGAFTSTVTQVFTASGTYTPTSGMKFCIIEVCGAGGGGADMLERQLQQRLLEFLKQSQSEPVEQQV